MLVLKRTTYMIAILSIILSCAATLTPQQRLLWGANVYNAQRDLYLEQVLDPEITGEERAALKVNPKLITPDMIRPDLTDEQRKILRVKKEILVELQDAIEISDGYLKSGGTPPVEVQNQITDQINRLLALIGD